MIRLYTLLISIAVSLSVPSISTACQVSARDLNQIPQQITPQKGEWLLIQAWTLDCAVCERQKPELSELNASYNNFRVVNLSLDGLGNLGAIQSRVSQKQYTMRNYVAELDSFRSIMSECFGKTYLGTPTYILYSPNSEVMAVRTGPFNLKALPKQLNLIN